MKEEDQIHGELMTPCFMTEEEFEAGYRSSKFYVEGDYLKAYREHMIAMSHVANVAKSYILNNWQKVEDWSDLEITLSHGLTGDSASYCKYVPNAHIMSNSKVFSEIMQSVDLEDRKRHNPILKVRDVVLDPTDGDFSITVNDSPYWWISDQAVILIANYIETKLKTSK
jgi:hypothetical protein